MTDETTNIVLEHLKRFQGGQDKLQRTLEEVKTRLTTLEVGQAGILSFIAQHDGSIAQQQAGLDRLSARVERIERRLDLADAP